ncbi:peptide ABC transporter substrate-binding protein [Niveispirillum sp. KHB5.9]|uniref:peptide ABC transporter substrate-binding protein n=1 Tax=Niveispirillum sp. KHB5.9 TaxID=3400269 RepID=UPI003A899B0F
MRVVTMGMLAALGLAAPAATGAEVLRLGNGPDISTLDWQKASTVFEVRVANDLCEGLLAYGASGEATPGVASDWNVSADGLTYTFKLRPDARWSDGSAVTAADFVAGWRRLVTPSTAAATADRLLNVENAQAILQGKADPATLGVAAPEAHTFTVRLSRRQADFAAYLPQHMLCPVHRPSLEKGTNAPPLPISNGAYVAVAREPQALVRLQKNPYFWDAASVPTETVEYHVTEDQQTEFKRFRTGDLHMTVSVPPGQLDAVRAEWGDALMVYPSAGVLYLSPNLTREPWSVQVKLRQAISLAIDRETLSQKVLRSGEIAAYNFVPSGIPGYTQPVLSWAKQTQAERDAKARQLLAEAGYGKDKPLVIEILHPTGDRFRQINIAVAAMLKQKLGVTANLRNEETKSVVAHLRARDYPDLALNGWNSDLPVTYLELLDGERGGFGPGYRNPTFGRLLEEARQQPGLAQMYAKLGEAERLAMEEAPVIPLLQVSRKLLVSPRLQGMKPAPGTVTPARFLKLLPAKP